MIIQYNIVVTIVNLIDNSTSKFNKVFNTEITQTTDALLYNNYHVLSKGVYIIDMFEDEINAYCNARGIDKSSIEIDEFEIVSLTDRADVFFEAEENENSLSLKPIIKCYVYPKNDALKVPNLVGVAYDSTTIIWSWPDDEQYAHYLVEEAIDPNSEADKSKIIAQLPIGATSYTETGLEPNTPYTRRLINYTDEQTSVLSPSVTVMTETVEASESLEEYIIPKNYDFTTEDAEREIIEENLEAFQSGIGDGNDLKVYKQMDADYYQKFKTNFEITGKRTQRERRYEQVGFNYKVCMEARETIEEQEGEVTFDVEAYPREWVSVEDYMWATHPVDVKTRLTATVFLRKESEQKEPEEMVLYKPNYEAIYENEVILHNTTLVLSLDCSTSQRKVVKDKTRRDIMVAAAKKCIDAFEKKAPGQLQYIIVGWAGASHVKSFAPGHAEEAKQSLDTIKISDGFAQYDGVSVLGRDCTNFYEGLTAAINSGKVNYSRMGQIFFTDGFCNMYGNTRAYGRPYSGSTLSTFTDEHCDTVIQSIKDGFKDAGMPTVVVFGASPNQQDPDLSSWTGKKKDSNLAFQQEVFDTVNGISKSQVLDVIQGNIDSGDIEDLASLLAQGVKLFETVEQFSHWEFKGWQAQPESIEQIATYNIDDIKAVTITTDIYSYTFNNQNTPIKYVRGEKRAIIPESSFLSPTKISDKNLFDIIMDRVKQTPEWALGYNKTIGTIENNGEPDNFLIKGLFIQDTCNYSDEKTITEANWSSVKLTDGMDGTVNTFTDIDKAGTSTYGDDCYLVSKNNYLMIQGYTDAIIYDGSRFIRTELNAYNHPSEILISKEGVYNDTLTNRKRPSLSYNAAGGTGELSHVIDIIEKDKDITLSGYNKLIKPGDWVEIPKLNEDLLALNEAVYTSPILNYRFNLEDPDAKTPLCEIMPECDPENNYLHIVLLHVYYAKNVFITNPDNYVELFGESELASTSSPYIPLEENLYQWTLQDWKDNTDNCWYIDEYIWFMAKKMEKEQDYYAELPGPGMDTFYGLVNGRYRSDGQDGKHDLRIDAPQFNIPTTVHKDTIKIYAQVTESYPDNALVSYKWANPLEGKDSVTQINGDYLTFSSDSITYKDVEYYDIISTVNMENQELYDNKTVEKIFTLTKPNTIYDYSNYYLSVTTDNADVLALRYPTEITFDEEGLSSFVVAFKNVINATSKWSPRIHNGYYYLNQHEYFAYSEFDVKANFDTKKTTKFRTENGYVTFDVQLRRKAKPVEEYSIIKDTRSELIQNEEYFEWVPDKGLTLKPNIDGLYYKEYLTRTYESPIILFKNILTEAGPLFVDYSFEDGSTYLPMQVRSYIVGEGKWSDWTEFINGTIPNVPLSCAYQVRFDMQASVTNTDLFVEDYLCCYLDWKEDMNEANTTNIVTITDHMTNGPYDSEGIFISNVIDCGCKTGVTLDFFDSHINDGVQLYICFANNPTQLLLENIKWVNVLQSKDYINNQEVFNFRYFRYKIVIPPGEKLYWLHKQLQTLETHALLPYISGISMTGKYQPTDIITNFVNTESFEIPKDSYYHTVFNRVIDVIGSDVLEKGYTEDQIESVKIQSTADNIEIKYDKGLNEAYPIDYLTSPIEARTTDVGIDIITKNTPYIFVEHDDDEKYDIIKITGTPQQYAPITVEDEEGNVYTQLHNSTSFIQEEEFLLTEDTKYLELKSNKYDNDFRVYIDGEELDINEYKIVNHLVIFNDFIGVGHTVKIEYCILYSFIAVIDRPNNTTTIYLHPGKDIPVPEKCKVYFETGTRNNKFIANDLSLNPIYRTDYKGFIYLTDEHTEPYEVKIYCNPLRLKAGGFDKVDVAIEIVDIKNNPVISKDVAVDCEYGILNCEDYKTDMNGVIHLVYESAYLECTDTLTARVSKDDGTIIEQSITIINE